jgi:NAD(P)-dependent dehydrogenase (short-subunit alcohol dehydrogenase family)
MADETDIGRRKVLLGGATALAAASIGMAVTGVAGAATRQGRFQDKVVLITGATSGIGKATAQAFASEGAKVAFCGRRVELGEEVAANINAAGGLATYIHADVREESQVKAFVDGCMDIYGRIDIAFNNAGIAGPFGPFADVSMEGQQGYRSLMATNVDGVYFAMRYEIPIMIAQGGGVIINTASMLGSTGSGGSGAYSGSKHAVIGFTQSAALANARNKVRVVSVSPGPVDTPLMQRATGGNLAPVAAGNPSGRLAQPSEIAALVLNLAAPESSYITGADFIIDGGATA